MNYRNWYTGQNYDRLNIILPKGSRELIREEARKQGKSLNEFIKGLIPERLVNERVFIRKGDLSNDSSGIEQQRKNKQG